MASWPIIGKCFQPLCFGQLPPPAVELAVLLKLQEPQYLLLVSYDDQGIIHKYETIRIATQCVNVFLPK